MGERKKKRQSHEMSKRSVGRSSSSTSCRPLFVCVCVSRKRREEQSSGRPGAPNCNPALLRCSSPFCLCGDKRHQRDSTRCVCVCVCVHDDLGISAGETKLRLPYPRGHGFFFVSLFACSALPCCCCCCLLHNNRPTSRHSKPQSVATRRGVAAPQFFFSLRRRLELNCQSM